MNKQSRGLTVVAVILILAGAAMIVGGVWTLSGTRDVYEYTFAFTNGSDAGNAAKQLLSSVDGIAESLGGTVSALSLGGTAQKVSIGGGENSQEADVYAITEGWLDIYPVFYADGRPISENELKDGNRVALIGDDLAFSLYGNDFPEQAKLTIGDETWTVAGVIRHTRGPGERSQYCVYVPLRAMIVHGDEKDTISMTAPALQSMTLAALPKGGGFGVFQTIVENAVQTNGGFFSLHKEAMRATMPARLLALFAGLCLLYIGLRAVNHFTKRLINGFAGRLKQVYFVSLLLRLLLLIAWCVLAYGLLIAALYALMTWSVQPLYVFTECVPDNLVSWASITKVFWQLTSESARLVKAASASVRRIEFYGWLIRTGVFTLFTGACLFLLGRLIAGRNANNAECYDGDDVN